MVADFDVAVVGGGPCGSTAAGLLARAGARVVLLDRAEFPRDKPCGGGVTGRAFAQAPTDLTPVVEQTVSKIRFSFRLGASFDYAYPRTLAHMTQRRRLDAFLLEKARDVGATVRTGELVRTLEPGPDVAAVSTSDGTITARVLIGADGANGSVARSLGLNPAPDAPIALEANFPYEAEAAEARIPKAWEGVLALELGSMFGGYGWSFPKADHFNVGCGGFRSEGGRLRQHLSALAGLYSLDPEEATSVRGHHLPTRAPGRPIARGTCILGGDAAGLIDPMSGEGIFAAFASGRLAAESALDYLRGRALDLGNYELAIGRELMPDIRAATLLRDAYHFFPGPCYALMRRSALLRNSLCRLMLGDLTYTDLVSRTGPFKPLLRLVAALGRRSQAGRESRQSRRKG